MLKFRVTSLDEVPENARSLYAEHDGAFVLQVDGAVAKERLDEFRTNNVAMKKQLDDLAAKYKDVDPAKYQEYSEAARKLREKELVEAGKVDELVAERTAAMRSEQDKQIKAIAGERDSMKKQLESLVIDGALKDAAIKAGVAATAVDDVLLRGRTTFRLVDGKAVAMDGDKQLFGKDSEPLGVAEWVSGLSEKAPHLFPASTGGGTPKGGSAATGGAKTMKRADFDALAPHQQAAVVKDTKLVD